MFAEILPQRDRLSGYSVAFNISVDLFGGLTPMIAANLIALTGLAMISALYLVVAAGATVLALALIPDRSRVPLR